MSYPTPSLNITDINELLFPHTINSRPVNTKSDEFNFTEVWQEIDTAAIALNEQSHCTINNIEQNPLAAFIGDITPAVAAVAAFGESPMMDTPFLDSCAGTPFTPATVFTPSLAQFQNSPYYNCNLGMNNIDTQHEDIQNDIQVATYLNCDLNSWHVSTDLFEKPPAITSANVTPELLNTYDNTCCNPNRLLVNSSIPQPIVPSVDNSSDSLFPPLPSDESTNMNNAISQQHEIFNAEDFEPTNFLENCFDECLFDMQEDTNSSKTKTLSKIQPTPMTTNKQITTNNKRKNNETTEKKSKRFKASTTDNSKDRRFECDICHLTFSRRYNLGTHIKIHTPSRIKDFACHLCTKAFDRKHDLTRHVATVHNGERAYSCNLCTSTFSRKDALVRHGVQKHQISA